MAELSIGDVARQAGINASAVRYYESVGLLPRPKRVNGRRRYQDDTVQTLSVILFAQKAGFSLTEIKTLFEGFDADTPVKERWQALARHKIVEVEESIQREQQKKQLLENGMQCACVQPQDCLIVGAAQGCERE